MNSLIVPSSPTIDFSAIERADLQPSTRDKYTRAIDNMMQSGVDPFDFPALSAYADSLSQSSRGFLKAALKIMTDGELTRIQAQATPDNINAIQALVARLEALAKAIPIHDEKGTKTHIWLSRQQVEQITSLPDLATTRGLRDYIVLATLLGAGIRREEMTSLTFSDLLQQPTGGGMRDVLRIQHGKGDKRRTIPISARLARHLKEWHRLAGDGFVARAVNKAGKINGSLSTQAVYDIVAKYGAMIGVPELQPHDCRRTFARLGYDAGVRIEQISLTLGHEDIETTMDYLGIDLDLVSPISDFIPLSGD